MVLTTSKINNTKMINPFPGLRPFTREESHLFFGREGQIENVAGNLLNNRFVAVIGSSGSGKSSLIYCGVLSKVTEKGKWKIIVSRPGTNPFMNLYYSVIENLKPDPETLKKTEGGQNPEKLLEILKSDNKKTDSQYLIVIDQFEELFRYRLAGDTDHTLEERSNYADFLVDLVENQDIQLNIIITMRSDFIGECSRFQKFTSLINKSNYLIPRMSRENFRRVIEEPVKITGASIEESLVNRILDEMGDNQDQLPILQHALMRTWSYWKENSNQDIAISISDYETVGGITRALSDHANEAFDELNAEEKTGCERIFRSLTEKGMDNRGVRRPTTVGQLARIAEIKVDSVIRIVDVFRAEGRSFLTPAHHIELTEESVVDLSHEALMRIWDRLSNWVEEEATAVTMYKRLSDSASLYQVGKSGLWRPPDLQLAINWKNKNNPNLPWAERYDPAFERTMVFLNTSQSEFEKEEANKLRLQRLRMRRTRLFAMVLGTAFIVSLVMFLWTRQLSVDLEQQRDDANTARVEAQQQRDEADAQRKLAVENLEKAEFERTRADTAAALAARRQLDAEENAREAARQTSYAQRNLREANRQKTRALEEEAKANKEREAAVEAREEAFTRRMLSIASSMAVKSLQITTDNDLKALLSQQAYKFNSEYSGNQADGDIYAGLYHSLKALLGPSFNQCKGHTSAVKSVSFIPGTSSFFSSGNDGRILKWNINTSLEEYLTILDNRNFIEKLAVSENGKFLLASETRNGLLYIDLESSGYPVRKLAGAESNILTMTISPNNNTAFTAGANNFIEVWDINAGTSTIFTETESRVNCLSLSNDGQVLVGGLKDGKTLIWEIGGNNQTNEIFYDQENPMQSATFSPDGKYLACGTNKGDIRIFRADSFEIVAILTGHVARVTDISFSPDGSKMVSTSYDGKVLFWNVDDLTSPPVEFTDNQGYVHSVSFSGDGNYFVCGSVEEARLLVRSTSADLYAARICSLISRNLTQDEWNIYVGEDILLEKTCKDIGQE